MDIKDFIPIVLFVITIGGMVGTFFKAKGMDEAQQKQIDEKLRNLHEIDEQQWKKIDDLKLIQMEHEKEYWEIKSSLELKIVGLHGENQKFQQMLQVIEKKLDEIIVRLQKGDK